MTMPLRPVGRRPFPPPRGLQPAPQPTPGMGGGALQPIPSPVPGIPMGMTRPPQQRLTPVPPMNPGLPALMGRPGGGQLSPAGPSGGRANGAFPLERLIALARMRLQLGGRPNSRQIGGGYSSDV